MTLSLLIYQPQNRSTRPWFSVRIFARFILPFSRVHVATFKKRDLLMKARITAWKARSRFLSKPIYTWLNQVSWTSLMWAKICFSGNFQVKILAKTSSLCILSFHVMLRINLPKVTHLKGFQFLLFVLFDDPCLLKSHIRVLQGWQHWQDKSGRWDVLIVPDFLKFS